MAQAPSPRAPRATSRTSRVRSARESLLDAGATEYLQRLQAVVCEVHRAQIVRALAATPLNVTEVAQVMGRDKSVVSRHLRVLREAEIVVPQRRGRQVFYRLADTPLVQAALGSLDLVTEVAAAAPTAPAR